MTLCSIVGVYLFNIHDDLTVLFACDEGYVGYSPSLATVIVAHQGTNPDEMLVQFFA